MNSKLKTKITAQEYRDGLPKKGSGVRWTLESLSVYVNLRFSHITVANGQECTGVRTKYKFVCEIHGQYEARADTIVCWSNGCQCRGCRSDNQAALAGTLRITKGTDEEKQLAAKLYSEGVSVTAIARQLGRSFYAIKTWLSPEAKEKDLIKSAKWKSENRERHNANNRRCQSEFEHGRAESCAKQAHRRILKTNTPEFVFLDNEWHQVDRKETYRVFKDFLLPPSEKKEMQELYLESQHLTETTGVEHHVDHLQPLSKGGEHRLFNLQVLPGDENLSKQATFREEDQITLINRLFND